MVDLLLNVESEEEVPSPRRRACDPRRNCPLGPRCSQVAAAYRDYYWQYDSLVRAYDNDVSLSRK